MATGFSFEEALKPQGFSFEEALKPQGFSFEEAGKPEPTPEEQSVFRQVADVPLKVGAGFVQGVRMIADAFGAGSETSQALRGAEDWIAALYSAQSKNDSREVARIMKEAEDKGVADQVKAGLRAFSVAPIDFTSQVLGAAAPTIFAALGAKILGAGALATTAITAGLGTVMGAGTVKGAIYDAVKEELAKTNMPKDEIEKRAELAQRYNGENLDQILMGGAIGGIAARTGLESSVAKAAAARIAGRAAAAEAAEAATRQQVTKGAAEAAARGPLRQGIRTAGIESGTEFLQGGQEQLAKNLALQREGYDVPTMRGVVGSGTLEALAGFPLGGAFGAREAIVARQEQARLADITNALNVSALEAEQPLEGVTEEESQIQDRMIELMASRYESVFPKDLAYAVALQMLEIRRNAEAEAKALGLTLPETAAARESTDTTVGVDPMRVRDLEDAFLNAGAEPGTARAAALAQATEEAYADWISERGAANVGEPVTPAGGEGVRVAGEPPAGPPTGGAGVSEATGVVSPATDAGVPAGRKEPAPGTLEQQANQWDRQNKLDRSGAWFEGAKSNEDAVAGFNSALQNGGDTLPAHGMAKESTLVGAVRNLLAVLTNGLDPSRRGGRLDYAPLVTQPGSAAAMVSTTPGGNAYSDGPFILVARPGQEFEGKLEGLGAILVNQANADIVPALRAEVQAIRPDVLVEPYSNAGEVAKQLTGAPSGTEASQTVEAKKEGPAVSTGAAQPATAKAAVSEKPQKPAKPEKPLNAWQLADKLASEVGGGVSAEAKQEELKKTLEARGVKPAGVDAAVSRFNKKISKTQPKARAVAAPKLSLRNARFVGAPGAERLFRASAAGKKYPGKFWSSIKEYAERYLTKGADKGQRTLDETAELPKRTLNITTLSQASQAERDAFLSAFTAWMQKNAPDVAIEDTQLYDVLTGQATDFAYPQKEDVKYLKYMGYDSVFFAEEGGEKVDTWFVFDKKERAEATEPKPKRERGRPALPKEEREARAEARTGVRAQANRDARRLQKAASDLTTKSKERRTDALYNLYDIYKTSQSTPRRSQAKGMLDANTTEAERRTIEDGYKNWQDKQAEIAAFDAAQKEQNKATRLTPEERKRQQEEAKAKKFRGSSIYIVEDLPDGEIGLVLPIVSIKAYPIEEAVKAGASFDEAKKAAEKQAFEEATKNVEGKTEGSTFRMVDKTDYRIIKQKKRQEEEKATAAERKAKQTERIRIQREDKIKKQKDKIATLGKRLAALRQNKPVNEAELLLREKQYKLEQLRLKVFEEKPIDWDADWEQGTKVRSLEGAAQEIRALQPKPKVRKVKSIKQLFDEAEASEREATEEATDQDDIFSGLFDKQVEEEEEVEEEVEVEAEPAAKKPAGEKKPKGKKLNPVTTKMYHGSPNAEIQEFSGLTFFTSDEDVAAQYAKKQVAFAGKTATGPGRVYQVSIATKNTLDLRKDTHRAAYNEARSKWNKTHEADEQLPSLTSEGFLISKTGLPSYGRIASVLEALPQFDSAFVDEGTQGTSLVVVDGSTAKIKAPAEPKQLTPQEQYAALVETIPGAPAFDALSEEAQKQIIDLAERNQLNLAAINRIASEGQPTKAIDLPQLAQATSENIEAPDTVFARFTNGAQTALHIARTATNGFHKVLAKRLSQLRVLSDVKFVVIEEWQALPAELQKSKMWPSSRGLYKVGNNTIYVRGASFGDAQGINNITILHELLHAALHKKVRAGLQLLGLSKVFKPLADRQLAKFVSDLTSLANRAKSYYEANMTELDNRIISLIEGTVRRNKDGTFSLDIFTPDEFVSYGMTEPDFQEFLKQVPGEQKRFTGFSQFVRSILDYFGMLPATKAEARVKADYSAMANLVDITDKLIGVRSIPKVQDILSKALGLDKPASKDLPQQMRRLASQKILKTAAQAEAPARRYPKEVAEELKKLQKALGSASSIQRKAREQAANADKILNKVLRSHSSSPQAMQGLQQAVNNRGASRQNLNDVLAAQYKGFKGGTLRQLLPALQTETVVDWAGRLGLNNVVLAYDQMKNLHAAQVKGLNEAAPISERLVNLQRTNPGMYRTLAATMHYSTLRGIDPSTEAGRKASPSLARFWNSLNPEAKSLYETVRDFHAKNYDRHFELLEKLVDSYGLEGNIADASTPKGSLIASIRRMQEQGAGIKPYFPLMRFGNFWVRTDKGKDSTFHMFESQAAKEAFIAQHVRDTGKSKEDLYADGLLKDGNDIRSARKDMGDYNELLQRMFANIDSMETQEVIDDFGNPSPELARIRKEQLKDNIYQMILHTLPDASYRKQFIHRQGKEGFSEDIGRSFATLSTAMANQLARLEYSQQIQNAFSSARSALEGNPDAARLNEFIKEMEARAKLQLDPSPENSVGNQMANFANQTAFLYMMTNVKTAVAQMFAIPTFVAPVLASKHGVYRTAKALGSFAAIWNSVGVRRENADGSTSWVAPTVAQSKRVKLNPEERRAAQYMVDRGLSETTLAYDLGNRKQTPTEVQNSAPRRMLKASVNAMTALFHHTERLAREVSFMASFRLNRKKFPNASFEEIAQLAEKETLDALGNYASTNRPRGLGANAEGKVAIDAHKPIGRAVLQFKMFPAFVTTYFVRNFYRMMGKGYTKEERKAAFVQFFGTLMMSFTLAGVMGIPGFSFALGVLSGLRKVMMGDDENDPLEKRDLELWFRNIWMPQTFGGIKIGGKPLSDLMDKGVLPALTGFDMTSSLSMNGLWLPSLKESPNVEASVKEYLLAIMGPFASLVGNQVPRAIDNFNRGKILEGMEQMMPAILRSPITAYRYSTEGAQTTWGAPIKRANEFTLGQIIGQGLGFSTEGLVARREDLFKANQEAIKVKNEKRSLMDRLDQEVRTDDDVQAAIEKIIKFNQKNWFDPIEGGDLSKSLLRRMERREKADRGADVEPKYYPQLFELLEGSRRKLEAEAAK